MASTTDVISTRAFNGWMACDPFMVLATTAREQHGVFSRLQANAVGFTDAELRSWLKRGLILREAQDVFGWAGAPQSDPRRAMSACLYAGRGSALSGHSAAANWGLSRFRLTPVEVSAVGPNKSRLDDVTLRRVDQALLPEIQVVNGMPTTSPRRTLLDLAGRRHPRAERALDESLRLDLVSLGKLWALYEEEWTRGRRGIRILRGLLIDRSPGAAKSKSQLVEATLRIIRASALPIPEREYGIETPFGTIHADLAYPELMVAIECDGYAYHMARKPFEQDRERDNELQELGWIVLRFTYAKINFEPDYVAHKIEWATGDRAARFQPTR